VATTAGEQPTASQPSTQRQPDRAKNTVLQLATLLATEPASIQALLARHVDDGQGKCRGCTLPQRGYEPWPCITYTAATIAAESTGPQATVIR
jgi:hypothetical protein